MNKKKLETYFSIERFHLQDKRVFPFHLYVYNPHSKAYSLFLSANTPMDQAKSELLEFIAEKGGEIAINMRQRKTFLRHFNYYDLDIPSLVPNDLTPVEKERLEKIHKIDQQENKGPHQIKKQIIQCLESENFLPMVLSAKDFILTLSIKVSHTVSLARYLAQTFMHEDTHLNRVVALSYFSAQSLGINQDQELGELTCAAFLAHIGETQTPPSLLHKAQLEFDENEKKLFQRHPALSIHLIKKSKVQLSQRCLKIIQQHHERVNGRGFPEQRQSAHIDQLALILGASAHVFEFSSGQVTGALNKLSDVLQGLKQKRSTPGLEFAFEDIIIESLVQYIEQRSPQKAA